MQVGNCDDIFLKYSTKISGNVKTFQVTSLGPALSGLGRDFGLGLFYEVWSRKLQLQSRIDHCCGHCGSFYPLPMYVLMTVMTK